MKITRREGAAAILASSTAAAAFAAAASTKRTPWPPEAGVAAGLPHLCLISGSTPVQLRHLKQLGLDYAIGGGLGPIPWTEDKIRAAMDSYKAGGVQVVNFMIGGFEDVIRGGPKRDEQIDHVIQSIRAAGRAGLPVIEYNFYAHRIVEGYYEELGRGGAGMTAFSHERVKDLPPLEHEGVHTKEQLFQRAGYFLKAIVPEAAKANVRLALHPNDPPAPTSRGSQQMMATFADWKRYLDLVKSPYNGMTYDCGVSAELGEDPVAVCRYLGERDVINHAHYRNVKVRKPYVDYAEVFIDEGTVNMYAVMKELVRQKYSRGLYPEHPRAVDLDRERAGSITGQYAKVGGGGPAAEMYSVGYTRAMLQAVLTSGC
jgi:mannonate dehydratase